MLTTAATHPDRRAQITLIVALHASSTGHSRQHQRLQVPVLAASLCRHRFATDQAIRVRRKLNRIHGLLAARRDYSACGT